MASIDITRWISRPSDNPTLWNTLSKISNKIDTLPNYEFNGTNTIKEVIRIIDELHDKGKISYLNQIVSITSDDIVKDSLESKSYFPVFTETVDHLGPASVLSIVTDMSIEQISADQHLLGITGTEKSVLYIAEDKNLSLGTKRHDVTTAIDLGLESRGHSELSLNKIIYGTEDIVLSALSMAADAMAKSIIDGFIPEREDLFDFMSLDPAEILRLTKDDIPLFDSVSRMGDSFSLLASKLGFLHADASVGTQILADSAAKTLGGYFGDALSYQYVGHSLPADVILTRFAANFGQATADLAAGALAEVFRTGFDIEDPLSQFVVGRISSALIDSATAEFLLNPLTGLVGGDEQLARAIFGLPAITPDPFNYVTIGGEILDQLGNGLPSFLGSQLFNFLDSQWEAIDLANEGSQIGGIIGNFIAPGIGGFIGQVAGGLVFDVLFDKDPRSFHTVSYDQVSGTFKIEFAFQKDGGDLDVSEDLASSARDIVQLVSLTIGGTNASITPFMYGHYEEKLSYIGTGDHQDFSSAEDMLLEGVMAQMRTFQSTGGNEYAKSLVSRADYNPSLTQFIKDVGTANEYGIHKQDPYLYGSTITNIADDASRDFLLADWARVLTEAHRLGFDQLSVNDGSEFLVALADGDEVDGGRGNDFIYLTEGWRAAGGEVRMRSAQTILFCCAKVPRFSTVAPAPTAMSATSPPS